MDVPYQPLWGQVGVSISRDHVIVLGDSRRRIYIHSVWTGALLQWSTHEELLPVLGLQRSDYIWALHVSGDTLTLAVGPGGYVGDVDSFLSVKVNNI